MSWFVLMLLAGYLLVYHHLMFKAGITYLRLRPLLLSSGSPRMYTFPAPCPSTLTLSSLICPTSFQESLHTVPTSYYHGVIQPIITKCICECWSLSKHAVTLAKACSACSSFLNCSRILLLTAGCNLLMFCTAHCVGGCVEAGTKSCVSRFHALSIVLSICMVYTFWSLKTKPDLTPNPPPHPSPHLPST